ncbi:MAG: YbhB/YbcL family Raf kinase inhibitor-like protein [Alphaproteobacteria bacterium]
MKITALTLAFVLTSGSAMAAGLTLTSMDLVDGGVLPAKHVFNGFGCSGGNVSPALSWSGAPEGTRSFALTVYDPDAPTGSGWWHWVVTNLPSSVTALPAGVGAPGGDLLPAGAVESRTDFGTPGYGGACPPEGDKPHRYIFTVHALKVDRLAVDPQASGAMAGYFINANTIEKASLMVRFGR